MTRASIKSPDLPLPDGAEHRQQRQKGRSEADVILSSLKSLKFSELTTEQKDDALHALLLMSGFVLPEDA